MKVLVLVILAACGPSPCERVAPFLMPNPDKAFVKRCELLAESPKFARAVDCLLEVARRKGGLWDADVASCPGGNDVQLMSGQF